MSSAYKRVSEITKKQFFLFFFFKYIIMIIVAPALVKGDVGVSYLSLDFLDICILTQPLH